MIYTIDDISNKKHQDFPWQTVTLPEGRSWLFGTGPWMPRSVHPAVTQCCTKDGNGIIKEERLLEAWWHEVGAVHGRRVRFEGFAWLCHHFFIHVSHSLSFTNSHIVTYAVSGAHIIYIYVCVYVSQKYQKIHIIVMFMDMLYLSIYIYIMFMYAHSVPQRTCIKHGYCNTARLNGKMSPALVPRGCSCNGPRPVLPPRPHAYGCSIRTCLFFFGKAHIFLSSFTFMFLLLPIFFCSFPFSIFLCFFSQMGG